MFQWQGQKYCSLEIASATLPTALPSIYHHCSIKIITLLPIGWILFHRSYRIKFYHFTFVSFVFPVFQYLYFPVFHIGGTLVLHISRQEMGVHVDKFPSTWIKWQKRPLFAALLKLWIKDPAVFREKCCRGAICHQRIHSAIYPGHTCTGHRLPKTLKIFRQQQNIWEYI